MHRNEKLEIKINGDGSLNNETLEQGIDSEFKEEIEKKDKDEDKGKGKETINYERIHPLFPTIEEVKANPDLVRSDHLPILTEVLIDEGNSVRILSLNTLGLRAASGLHDAPGWEELEGTRKRYQRMVEGVVINSIKKHGVDFICFQEVDNENIMENLLQDMLTEDWVIKFDDCGIITCFNIERFELIGTKYDKEERIRTMQLKDKTTDSTVDIHNVWGKFTHFPDPTEALYKTFFNNTEASISVIVGDTNSRIAPIDELPRNITTGAIPCNVSFPGVEIGVQKPDYPDGGFCKTEEICQLKTSVLDFETAEIVEDTRDKSEYPCSDEFRMLLCLDSHYAKNPAIANQTIFSYEADLKAGLNDPNLLVRVSANSFNEKAIGIRFSRGSRAFQHVQEQLQDVPACQFPHIGDDPFKQVPCVFVPLEYAERLHQALMSYEPLKVYHEQMKAETISEIDAQIKRFEKKRMGIRRSPGEKVEAFNELKEKVASLTTAHECREAIREWEQASLPKIKKHRNRFFSPSRSKPTRAERALEGMKTRLRY